MPEFNKGDVIVDAEGRYEQEILEVFSSGGETYYWVKLGEQIPATFRASSLASYRLKPKFFEVGDEFEYSGWGYRVTHVDASPLSAWAIATELNSGDQQRDTLTPYDFERFGKSVNKG